MSRQLSVTRFIAAPPERVWQVMTERMGEWWCPRPWRTEEIDIDWRPGGRSNMVMRGPNGEEMPQQGIILELVPGRRWVSTDAFTEGWQPSGPFMVGVWEIEAEGEGTRYRASARHWTDEACEQHRDMGFEQGWRAVADQLAELAEGEG